MQSSFYRLRQHKLVSGVVAGLADKFGWEIPISRVLAALFIWFSGFGIILYVLLAIFLPYKEDLIADNYGTGPRKRKEADVSDDKDGWFW